MSPAGRRRKLVLSPEDRARLETIRRSRTDEKRRTVRAAILLDAADGVSDQANAAARQVNRNTVMLCIRKYLSFGIEAALGELPRSGKPRRVSDDAIAWIQNLACQKPKDLGYAQELWTYQLLTGHIRREAPGAGHTGLARLSRSKLHRILGQGELRPHRVRYYGERRDPAFAQKMAAVLHVYKEVEIINQGLVTGAIREPSTVTVSYDEKPGIQALAVTTPDRPPVPGSHASHLRDYEYKRLGTVSLLAGIDLHSGSVTEIVNNTHKSRDFIEFLTKLDGAYPATQTLRLILDNHSAHISKETQRYLATRPQRFQFVFLPKHGSWLNLVENLFSKMTRTMLREIRVKTKQELVDRIHLYFHELNATPVVFHWKYKMDETPPDLTS
jgi:transposase